MNEIRALLGTVTNDGAHREVHDLCADAMVSAAENINLSGFEVGDVDLPEYFEGSGLLNKETGNFQQSVAEFHKRGGYNAFVTISDDPQLNEHYRTTKESFDAGEAVKNLYQGQSKNTFFEKPDGFEECASHTAMCCWGRDRQYFDQNGSCNHRDCAHENPGDNTDLCWTEHDEKVYPYPGDKTENNLHCHGISWADNSYNDANFDLNTEGKWNNLFYVSLYDHMYQRGYVESITNDELIAGVQPMCGCIEDMNPVARADCQQVNSSVEYKVSVNNGKLVIEPKEDTFQLKFEACEGLKYVENLDPDEYESELNNGEKYATSNNDLAGFVFKQWLERKITDDHVEKVEKTLVGYRDPSVNENDKNREEACKAAFEKKYPNKSYEEVKLTVETTEVDV